MICYFLLCILTVIVSGLETIKGIDRLSSIMVLFSDILVYSDN